MKDAIRLIRYSLPYWYAVLASVVLMAAAGAANAMIPLLIGPVFGRVLNPAAADTPVALFKIPVLDHTIYLEHLTPSSIHNVWTMIAFAIAGTFLIKGLSDYVGNYLVNYAGLSAVTDLRQHVFDKVLRHGSDFFETHATGKVMSSIMNDIDKIQVAVSHMLADWFRQSFAAACLLFVVIATDWRLAAVSLTLFPFVLVPTARLGRRIRRVTRSAQDRQGEVNHILHEALAGHQVVKSFATEGYESARFRAAARRLKQTNLKYILHQAIASPLIEFFAALTIVALLTYARNQIKTGAMTIDSFTTFITALLLLYDPVKRLTGIHNIFQQAVGASQKVFEYLDREVSVRSKPNAPRLGPFKDAIVFENVSFRYPASPNGFLLENVNLEVKAGEVVALVGPSGAGKTTLANLVPRFYDVGGGSIRIDGRDIREFDLNSLRGMIGIVAQDTFLFNDTVVNNLRYGRQDASDDEVRAAARNALADEFIERLPQGYQTVIGERGARLSGGQRQRIAIARALITEPALVVLDEPVSALDVSVQAQVLELLLELKRRRGLAYLFVSHDLAVVAHMADRVAVLQAGRIVEEGPVAAVLGRPRHAYTQRLLAATLPADPRLARARLRGG